SLGRTRPPARQRFSSSTLLVVSWATLHQESRGAALQCLASGSSKLTAIERAWTATHPASGNAATKWGSSVFGAGAEGIGRVVEQAVTRPTHPQVNHRRRALCVRRWSAIRGDWYHGRERLRSTAVEAVG